MKHMGERIPTSYSQEPIGPRGTTHKPSWSRSGGGGVDGDGSGGNSPLWQGAGTENSIPRIRVLDGGGASELFVDGGFAILNF